MATPGIGTDRPVSPLDRYQTARIEVGHTHVSPRVARTLVVWFLLMLAALPLLEWLGARAEPGARSPWAQLGALPQTIFDRLAQLTPGAPVAGIPHPAFSRIVTANRAVLATLSTFEEALEDQSMVGRWSRPYAQVVLSGALGAGNERVYVGRDGWLFYRPDVESLTGPGFLHPGEMARRVAIVSEFEAPPQPDPRPAILRFHQDLAARGITLVLMPTPVKPGVHPERLSRRASDVTAALQNPSYRAWQEDLERAGVLVFDPAPGLVAAAAAEPQYLVTDTHWRPEAMQRVAEQLAAFLERHVAWPEIPAPDYRAEPREAQHTGDTAAMLDLPAGQTLYPAERVTLRFIVGRDGDPWRSSREADVLVLGDSFSNMYSLASMRWGESAGFVEQLSYVLQRPIDRIVQNDQAAHATRGLLARDPSGAANRLRGKRVVIWQFATRELAFGDWRVIELPAAR